MVLLLSLSFAAFNSVVVDDCNLELNNIFKLFVVVGIAKELGVMNADDKHI